MPEPVNPPASEATLLDVFAGQAMTALTSLPGQTIQPTKIAAASWIIAAAMLAARPDQP